MQSSIAVYFYTPGVILQVFHLNPFTGDELGVPGAVFPAPRSAKQWFRLYGSKRFVDRGAGNVEAVNSLQLILDSAGAKTTIAELSDPFTMLIRKFGSQRRLRSLAVTFQTVNAVLLKPTYPFAQRRS